MKTINRTQVEFEIIVHPEHTPLKGNVLVSGDDQTDTEAEEEIARQLENGNEWAWCTIEVKAKYKSLEASDYLGCCSYASEEDFKKDGYYLDMKDRAFEELQNQVNEIVKDLI